MTKENDLLLNLGECGILFITYLDGRESWRIFRDDDQKHLVATNEALSFEKSSNKDVILCRFAALKIREQQIFYGSF